MAITKRFASEEYVDQKIAEFEASLPTTTVADDGNGNVTLSYSSLSSVTDDGEGNVTITN